MASPGYLFLISKPTVFSGNLACPVQEVISQKQVQRATSTNLILHQVIHYAVSYWPCKRTLSKELTFFNYVRNDLSIVNNLFLRGERIAIPASPTHLVNLARDTHPGIVRTKQRLRQLYWWPSMDSHVERVLRACQVCLPADKPAKTFPAPVCFVSLTATFWENSLFALLRH